MNKPIKIVGLLLALVAVNGVFIILWMMQDSTPKEQTPKQALSGRSLQDLAGTFLTITTPSGETDLTVYIADNPNLHYLGLSHTAPLSPTEGMLFIYPEGTTFPRFVMRDMNYALDISFFDKEGNLVSSHRNLPPCTPDLCTPVGPEVDTPIHYVLETIPRAEEVTKIKVE